MKDDKPMRRFWERKLPEPPPYEPVPPSPSDLVFERLMREDALHKQHAPLREAALQRVREQNAHQPKRTK